MALPEGGEGGLGVEAAERACVDGEGGQAVAKTCEGGKREGLDAVIGDACAEGIEDAPAGEHDAGIDDGLDVRVDLVAAGEARADERQRDAGVEISGGFAAAVDELGEAATRGGVTGETGARRELGIRLGVVADDVEGDDIGGWLLGGGCVGDERGGFERAEGEL